MINAARNFVKWLQDYVVDLPDDLSVLALQGQ